MAQFLLIPVGSSGDTHPLIGIGKELLRRGHVVTVFVNGYFKAAVERAGLKYREAGTAEQYLSMLNNPDIWDPRKGFEAIINNPLMSTALRAQFDVIREHFVIDPNLTVVAGTLALGARIAEEKLGVRTVSAHLQPMMFFSTQYPNVTPKGKMPEWMPRPMMRFIYWLVDKHIYGPVIGRLVEPLRAELGLQKASRYLGEWMHSPKLALGLFPKWFAFADDWPKQLRLTGFPLFDDGADQALSQEVETYLNQREAPIVFTFGTGMRSGERLFAAANDACERLGRRGILLTPFREQLPVKLSSNATHFGYIPLGRLLPRVAAIVHHGGIGTTSQALRAGVPQVITPLSHDQFDNADRVRRLGAGAMLSVKNMSAETLASGVLNVCNDVTIRSCCRETARRFDNINAIADTCDVLEAFEN